MRDVLQDEEGGKGNDFPITTDRLTALLTTRSVK
jgi:hypothetical protein